MPTIQTFDDLLNTSELCRTLRASKGKVLELIHNGAFPGAFRLGTDWRIPVDDVRAYIERNRVQPPKASAAKKRGAR